MGDTPYPSQRHCWIPARCFNLASLVRSRAGGNVSFGLPELSDNVMFLSASNWRCWNRRLDAQLLSWSDFNNAGRSGLHDPVACTLTLHHSYSRTIIHRVYDSLQLAAQDRLGRPPALAEGRLLFLFG